MFELWVPITIAAAFCQNARSALQKHLTGRLTTLGAAYVRFLYAWPFAVIYVVALHGWGGMALPEAWGKGLNAHILAWTHFKGQKFYIYTRFKPKFSEKTGLDLTGVKMRSTGLYNPFLKAMHATPVNISPGDVYSGLERGLVQGLAWPWGSVAKYGWQRFLKYRIEPDFFGASMLMLVNLKKWKSPTNQERGVLTAAARSYESKADEIIIAKGHADDKKLKEAGVEMIRLTGKIGKAYIETIYKAKWAQNDQLTTYIIDYKKLKSLMYTEPGS